MENNWLAIFLIAVIIIVLLSPPTVQQGGSWCTQDSYYCTFDEDEREADHIWRGLPPRVRRLIIRLFRVRLTGWDVKSKVADRLNISPTTIHRRFAHAFMEYIEKHLGNGGRVDWVINSEWRRLPRVQRQMIVNLFNLRWGNGVYISRQMMRKLRVDDPEIDPYDLMVRIFRRRRRQRQGGILPP